MAVNLQTFPTDLLLPGLVSWFNSQSAELRVIDTNDVALFRVRLVEEENGTIRMVVGAAPYEPAGSTYLYEATFIWAGARGINLTATAASFFEISKFVAAPAVEPVDPVDPNPTTVPINIIPFTGYVELPADVVEPIVRFKMTSGLNLRYDSGGMSRYTVGLSAAGVPQIQSDSEYTSFDPQLTGVVELVGGDTWIGARTGDGRVFTWGDNYNVTDHLQVKEYDIGYYSGSSTARSIAALKDTLVVADESGQVILFGSQDNLGDSFYFPDNVIELGSYWHSEYNQEDGFQHEYSVVFSLRGDGSFDVRSANHWDQFAAIGPVSDHPGMYYNNARKVTGTFDVGAVISEDDELVFWGDTSKYDVQGYQPEFILSNVKDVVFDHNSHILVLKNDGGTYYCNGTEWLHYEQDNEWISGGYEYVLAYSSAGNLVYYGNLEYGQDSTPDDFPYQEMRQVHAGTKHTFALLNNGDMHWWGGSGV